MPSRRNVTPESYQPLDHTLLETVARLCRRSPCASLREVCGVTWGDLAWAGAVGADSATGRTRTWTGGERTTAAVWLLQRLERLVLLGALRHGPRRRDEVDILAGVAFVLGSAGAIALLTPKQCADCSTVALPGAVHGQGCHG